jgi:hypothetical protein
MSLRLVNKLEENVVDRTSNESPQIEEFTINTMKGGLEEVALSWVLTIE